MTVRIAGHGDEGGPVFAPLMEQDSRIVNRQRRSVQHERARRWIQVAFDLLSGP